MIDLDNKSLPSGLNFHNETPSTQTSSSSAQIGGFDTSIDIRIMKHVFGGKNSIHKIVESMTQKTNGNKSRKTNIKQIKTRAKTKSNSRTQKKNH